MPVSSNSLFHFTNSIKNIESILKEDFIPNCSLENLFSGDDKIEFAYPVVCFCDIPLSQVKEHINVYGNYGIGLSKTWGITNGLNPVLYIETTSNLAININDIFDYIILLTKQKNTEKAGLSFKQILKHIKSYEGDFNKNGRVYPSYRFYNEREWRYLPEIIESLNKVGFNHYETRLAFNKRYEHLRLRFTPEDIKYIIIENEAEIGEMIRIIRNLKGDKYSMTQVEKLITRIISAEQILNDF